MQISCPRSRSSLWDCTPVGETTTLHLTQPGWPQLKVSSNAIQLAVRHASQTSGDAPKHFWLIASSTVSEGHRVLLEINRFDRGKFEEITSKRILRPTAYIPGDLPLSCEVVTNDSGSTRGYLTHNTLQLLDSFSTLTNDIHHHQSFPDYSSLLLCRVIITYTPHCSATLQCGCILPGNNILATPIQSLSLASTPLTRNLTGSQPLSTLQGRSKSGYLTMESTRRVVPLLHSDPHVLLLPLVGIWVSGVSLHHPIVWMSCQHFLHTTASLDRVVSPDQGKFLLLLLSNTTCSWYECSEVATTSFQLLTGQVEMCMPATGASILSCELLPVVSPSSAYTVLHSALDHYSRQDNIDENSIPLPSPHPASVPTLCIDSDTELSSISSVIANENVAVEKDPVKKDEQQLEEDHVVKESEAVNTAGQYLQQQRQQLAQLQEQVKTLLQNPHFSAAAQQGVYTIEASTNTGQSLLSLTASQDGSSLLSLQTLEQTTLTSTASSFLDITSPDHNHCNYESSPELGASASCYQDHSVPIDTSQWKDNSDLYLRLKEQVNELLSHPTLTNSSNQLASRSDITLLPVPRIHVPGNLSTVESTLDEHAHMADLLTHKYLPSSQDTSHTHDEQCSAVDMSVASRNYLQRHGLDSTADHILDIGRLKQLPKLL